MIHLHNDKAYLPRDASPLLLRARSLLENLGIVVRDARVSSKFVEFDASMPDEKSVKEVLSKLEGISPIASYEHVVERHMEKEDAIKHAIKLFNEEKYWGAHETLEGVWKSATGTEKDILNGIILVAAAFVHDEKDEQGICLSILRRALKKLEHSNGTYFGIEIDRLVTKVREIINSGKIERFAI